jgi:hypothetical protein
MSGGSVGGRQWAVVGRAPSNGAGPRVGRPAGSSGACAPGGAPAGWPGRRRGDRWRWRRRHYSSRLRPDTVRVVRNTFEPRGRPVRKSDAPSGAVYAGRLAAYRELRVIAAARARLDLPVILVGPADPAWSAGFGPGWADVRSRPRSARSMTCSWPLGSPWSHNRTGGRTTCLHCPTSYSMRCGSVCLSSDRRRRARADRLRARPRHALSAG